MILIGMFLLGLHAGAPGPCAGLLEASKTLLPYLQDPNAEPSAVIFDDLVFHLPPRPADRLRQEADDIEEKSKAIVEFRRVVEACEKGKEGKP